MNDLIQDTWHDLRAKRLWPVAVVLALAIVAIPVLLTKSAAQPPVVTPVVTDPDADERIAVHLDGEAAVSSGAGSPLDKFEEGDPFTPPGAIVARAADGATATATISGPTADDSPDDAGAGGGREPTVGSPPDTSPRPPTTVVPPQTRTETAEYEYVADVTFWNGDRRRELSGLRKLDMLPNQSAPVLIFMGTADNGGNAVFLVDSTLKATGEGRCVPGPENCAYVHVGPGAEHVFTTEEGDAYRLRVDEIRRVEVKPSASKSRKPVANGSSSAARRFQLPSLVDLVSVTETTTGGPSEADPKNHSSSADQGR
jgi:hypothetical protein